MITNLVQPLIPERAQSPSTARRYSDAIRKESPTIANALDAIQQALDRHERALRATPASADEIKFTDSRGRVIAWLGSRAGAFGGWFGQLYVAGTGPDDAPLFVDETGILSLGRSGYMQILDPNGSQIGWLGTEIESAQAITDATFDTPAVISLTAHGYENGDSLYIYGATGNTAINGYRLVANVTTDTFELTDFAGNPIDGDGTYTGGGFTQRYYGGGLLETLAIGQSFANYKLRAFPDGTLKIRDALITLTGSDSVITLDPDLGSIIITPNPATGRALTLDANKIELVDRDGLAVFRIIDNERPGSGLPPPPTEGPLIWTDTGSGAVYTLTVRSSGSGGQGASVVLQGWDGTKDTPTATGTGGILGTLMFEGYSSGQSFIRGVQDTISDTSLLLATSSSGFTFTRLKADQTGVSLPNSGNLNVPGGYIAVGGVAASGKKLTVVGASYLNGNVEFPALTATRPLKLNASKIATADQINLTDKNDVKGLTADSVCVGGADGEIAQVVGVDGAMGITQSKGTIYYLDHAGNPASLMVVLDVSIDTNYFTKGVRTT